MDRSNCLEAVAAGLENLGDVLSAKPPRYTAAVSGEFHCLSKLRTGLEDLADVSAGHFM